MSRRPGLLTVDDLRAKIDLGQVDTVLVAITDMQGRLQGKRLAARYFLDEVLHHGTEGCNYLLAVDVDMNTVDGYAMSSWDTGYGDFVMAPDFDTLRIVPWHPGTALVLADVQWEDGVRRAAVAAPDPAHASSTGCPAWGSRPCVGTELEFIVFRDSYEQAWDKGYRDLVPANQYNVDYSMMGTRTGRAAPATHPHRDGRRPGCMWSRPRGSATSVSTRSPSSTTTR